MVNGFGNGETLEKETIQLFLKLRVSETFYDGL